MRERNTVIGSRHVYGLIATCAGIATTTPDTIKRWSGFRGVAIVTSKSINLTKRAGNSEPIICQKGSRTYVNAVGLTSPDAEHIAKELKAIYPLDNFLMASIQGGNVEEFLRVAEALRNCCDGYEANVSCPHSEGRGKKVIDLADKIVCEVKKLGKPVFVKLPPADNIGEIARKAVEAGATGITAVNTAGPVELREPYTNKPILSNIVGGVSGEEIKELGLRCVAEVRQAVGEKVIIIGEGGVSSGKDITDYLKAGADFVGVGSAFAGMGTATAEEYVKVLLMDHVNGTNKAALLLPNVKMKYEPYKLMKVRQMTNDLKIFYFDKGIDAVPAQFVFAWLPGKGEKPFSIADDEPLTLAIRKIGSFTSAFFDLREGEEVMIRGPYGNGFKSYSWEKAYLVGGGTGAAPINLAAKYLKKPTIFLGATQKEGLIFLDELGKRGEIILGIDNGKPGKIVDELAAYLKENPIAEGSYFFNCGPERMMKQAIETERAYASPKNIFASVERYTKCGVGLCGSCAVSGFRSCVDGPVFDSAFLEESEFGRLKRDRFGELVTA